MLIHKPDNPGSTKDKVGRTMNGGALGLDNPTFHASAGWDWISTIRGRDTGIWSNVSLHIANAVTVEDPLVTTTLPPVSYTHLDVYKRQRVTLANAGHMPPYLNGEPLAVEGTLPLGMIEGNEISVMRFSLKEGDRLVLLSDGVVEATDASGHLFGFERVHELLHESGSAAEVATACLLYTSRCV